MKSDKIRYHFTECGSSHKQEKTCFCQKCLPQEKIQNMIENLEREINKELSKVEIDRPFNFSQNKE